MGSERTHGEVRFQPADGYRKTFRVIASALTVPGKGMLGSVYTLDDLTAIRRLEREVRMQDRLAAVGRLAAAIAHEIRNPLTSIAGSVSMLSGATEMTDEQRQLLRIVTRESERLNQIITDFLAYSRGKQYRFDRVDLIPLVEDTLTLLEHRLVAENAGIRIERRIDIAEAWTLADGDKIKQVFWNFCQNAVRAMREGRRSDGIAGTLGEDWQINFADTGEGMSTQQTEKIFEPFQSGFEGGTGLGLAIVYQIVQAHEGKVWARSREGEGTTFVLRLRRLAASRAEEQLDSAGRNRAEGSCRYGRTCSGRRGREGAWVTSWSATTSARSAKCSTSPCGAKATRSRPSIPEKRRSAKSMAPSMTSSSPTSRCPTSTASRCCVTPMAPRRTRPSS